MKVCRECGQEKSLEEFYVHKAMADGRLNKCKVCVKSRVAQHRGANLDRIQAYDRERGRTPEHRDSVRAYYKTAAGKDARRAGGAEWARKNRHKKAAHLRVRRAILSGKLQRQPCESCGSVVKIEAHHEDYSKPLDVRWLCDTHHKARHIELRWSDEE